MRDNSGGREDLGSGSEASVEMVSALASVHQVPGVVILTVRDVRNSLRHCGLLRLKPLYRLVPRVL